MAPPFLAASRESPLDWYSFLARPRLPSLSDAVAARLSEAAILVTGAGGSIGSALSLRLAALRPRRLVLLDASEQALYRLQEKLAETGLSARATCVLGDITDEAQVEEICATDRPELVLHAAAYKHVPLLEEHPLAAIATNALGTEIVARQAMCHGAARVVLLSTDKAVAPASILGASKRIAERVVLAQGGVVLRLANVLGSEGSVVQTFLRQIAAGGPVSITDRDAERYFLTGEEAVDLLLEASISASSGSLLVPQLTQPHRIVALAEFLMEASSPAQKLPFNCIGLRPGDKTREALWSCEEQPEPSVLPGCMQIAQAASDDTLQRDMKRLRDAVRERDLPRVLEIVLALVPDYAPSATILTLAHKLPLNAVPYMETVR